MIISYKISLSNLHSLMFFHSVRKLGIELLTLQFNIDKSVDLK
jgi:hypothetical protein